MKENKLNKLRRKIDGIDKKVLHLLEKRMDVSKEIGRFKKENGFKIEDKEREKELVNSRVKRTSLSKGFVRKFFGLVFLESKKIQKRL